jgi:hypothetical protein
MDMVTLHELSVMLDISVRVLRSRVRQLVQSGKLIEGRDCHRDDYVDETHFVWKISPTAFIRETGFKLVAAPSTPATRSDNQPPVRATELLPEGGQTLIKPDSKPPGMEREMIELLKGQLVVKDGQIADLTAQNKTVVTLNEKLTGAVVHHTEQIKNLLQLTGGKMEPDAVVSPPVAQRTTTVSVTDAPATAEGSGKVA